MEDGIAAANDQHKSPTTQIGQIHTNDSAKNTDQTTPLFHNESKHFGESNLESGFFGRLSVIPEVHSDIGETKESLLQSDYAERQRYINRLQDTIRGIPVEDGTEGIVSSARAKNAPPKIVAVTDKDAKDLVVIGVNSYDRPGLLLDISKTVIRLGLNCHRTEAMVLDGRSFSLWRCEVLEDGISDIEEIWSVLNAMLEINTGVEAIKSRGIRVIRAIIPKRSSLVGVTASDINFREKYKCAIVAIHREKRSPLEKLSQTKFTVGDVLVLQVNDDSPLLIPPPQDYYRDKGMPKVKSSNSISRFVRKRFGSFGSLESIQGDDDRSIGSSSRKQRSIRLDTEDIESPNIISQVHLDEESSKEGDGYSIGGSEIELEDTQQEKLMVRFHTSITVTLDTYSYFDAGMYN